MRLPPSESFGEKSDPARATEMRMPTQPLRITATDSELATQVDTPPERMISPESSYRATHFCPFQPHHSPRSCQYCTSPSSV
jgi:hypothetical protein